MNSKLLSVIIAEQQYTSRHYIDVACVNFWTSVYFHQKLKVDEGECQVISMLLNCRSSQAINCSALSLASFKRPFESFSFVRHWTFD